MESPCYHRFSSLCCTHCGSTITIPVYCGNRFCPVCSTSRTHRIRSRMQWILDRVRLTGGQRLKFITLTIPNMPDPEFMLSLITTAFKSIRNTKLWSKRVPGGLYVAEITGNPGNWHVHLHIVCQSEFMPYKALHRLWMQKSPGRGVWIQNIPKKQAINYLTKYLTKDNQHPDRLELLNNALKGQRLFQPFGTWHNINATYTPTPHPCAQCGHVSWLPQWILYGRKSPDYIYLQTNAKEGASP